MSSSSAPVCQCGAQASWRRTHGTVPSPVCVACKLAHQRRGGSTGAWEPIPAISPLDDGRPGSDPRVLRQHAAALRAGPRPGDVLIAARLLEEAAAEIEVLRSAGRAG